MLDIQLRKMLDQMQAAGVPGLSDLPPALAREAYSQIARAGDVAPQGATIETRSFAGPGGPLALRIYRPQGDEAPHGVVLFIHGGGFVLGSPSDYDGVCSSLCRQSGCVLVQVDYRLGTRAPLPGGGGRRVCGAVLGSGTRGRIRPGIAADRRRRERRRQPGCGSRPARA
jgi:acetyl esterase